MVTNASRGVSRETTADDYTNRPDKHDNILAPVEEQCRWLRRLGFTDMDCFFKAFELAIFGGRRLANPQPNGSVSLIVSMTIKQEIARVIKKQK